MDIITLQGGKLNLDQVITDVQNKVKDIPFGNSDFQNINFVVKAQLTPGRKLRAAGLRARDRINALKEARYNLEKELINIEELEDKVQKEFNHFEKRRLQLDIVHKKDQAADTQKLVNDALHELSVLYSELKKLPNYDRGKFEAEEQEHWDLELKKQILGIQGAKESLLNMGALPDSDLPLQNAFNRIKDINKLNSSKKSIEGLNGR